MATYIYKAKKGPQDIVEGKIEAQSEEEAVDKISQSGYFPLHIELEKQPYAKSRPLPGKRLGKIRAKEVTIFTRQLAILIRSGVPILTSLNIIFEQSNNPSLRMVLDTVHNAVKEGSTFSASLTQYPRVFSPLYVAMVQAGEGSGALPEVLLRIADHRAKEEEMLSHFRMALAYPILMAIVGIGTIVFMLTFVIPRLMRIFVSLGQALPLPTRILISISDYLRQWWLWVGLLVVIIVVRQELKTNIGRVSFSIFKLRLPIFGKFILKTDLARFCRTLELLIKNGIPILKAIDIAVPVVTNDVVKSQLKLSYKALEQGGSFGQSIKDSKLFPAFMSNLLIVGEESGKLTDALGEVASSYELDTDEAIKIMSSLLEPLMILVMGLIVGFIVVAMLLPIFEINVMAR